MTHTAITFSIRKHATPRQWKQIEAEARAGLPTSPLRSSSALSMVLADPIERQSVQWLHVTPVTVERPEKVAAALDAHLTQQAQELRLRQIQNR